MTTIEFLQQRHGAADRNTIQLWKNKGLGLYLGFPGSSSGKESPAMQETPVQSWVWRIPWRREWLPTPVFLGFLGGSDGKESTCNVGDLGLIPGLGRSPGEGKCYPLQPSVGSL